MTVPVILEVEDKLALTKEETKQLDEMIRAAARRVAAQWPTVVEWDDLRQDIWVHLLERPGALNRIFEEQDDKVRQAFLIKVGHQIASEEQIAYERFSGNSLYSVMQVRGLLERKVWKFRDKVSADKMDLMGALKLLAKKNSGHYAEIVNRFEHDIFPQGGADKMRLQRAVESLTELMNRLGQERRKRHTEGPGTRKVISNSAAQALTARQWNGESRA